MRALALQLPTIKSVIGAALYLFLSRSAYLCECIRSGSGTGRDAENPAIPLAQRPSPKAHAAIGPLDDDAWLVAEAKQDPHAFAPLYTRYFDLVYRYGVRRLGVTEAAADATGQVFAKALAALPRYRDDAPSFRSWLFAIAHNVIIDGGRTSFDDYPRCSNRDRRRGSLAARQDADGGCHLNICRKFFDEIVAGIRPQEILHRAEVRQHLQGDDPVAHDKRIRA